MSNDVVSAPWISEIFFWSKETASSTTLKVDLLVRWLQNRGKHSHINICFIKIFSMELISTTKTLNL